MLIKEKKVTIRELVDKYSDSGDGGVVGYGGRLNIRPPYQREFVYDPPERNAVIDSVLHGYPINAMYWMKQGPGSYELLDGQQRTISICQFRHDAISVEYDGTTHGFDTLPDDIARKMLEYELMIYVCKGEDSERQKWFETINIAGKTLSKQEIRNAIYSGPWVNHAKGYFVGPRSNSNSMRKLGKYLGKKSDGRIRYSWLEKAISWHKKENESIESYMKDHKNNHSAVDMWNHLNTVIDWVEAIFPSYYKEMNGLDWGRLYREKAGKNWDPKDLDCKVKDLMAEGDVHRKAGIWGFLLTGDKRLLGLRAFPDDMKATAYQRQNGNCKGCGEPKERDEMHADHINPFAKGGPTTLKNLQMLCATCNLQKGKK